MKTNRKSDHVLWFEGVMRLTGDSREEQLAVRNVPFTWHWDECGREAAEYWAAVDYIAKTYGPDWFSISAWGSSPEQKETRDD